MEEKRIATIYDLFRMVKSYDNCNEIYIKLYKKYLEDIPTFDRNKYIDDRVDEINNFILKWCDEHPQKTYKDDFLEKFPNAIVGSDNHAGVCRKWIYGKENCKGYCTDCWNEVFTE